MAVEITALTEPKRTVKYNGRCIEYRWLVREEPYKDYQGDAPWRIYAELSIHHHGRAEIAGRPDRCFTATLGRAKVRTCGAMTSQSFGLSNGPASMRILEAEACPRFSPKRLEAYAEKALARLPEILDDEHVQAIFDAAR